jgi:hypothetical protein
MSKFATSLLDPTLPGRHHTIMSGTIKGIKEANEAGTGYDRRRPIELKGLALAWMSFQTLGMNSVFGVVSTTQTDL